MIREDTRASIHEYAAGTRGYARVCTNTRPVRDQYADIHEYARIREDAQEYARIRTSTRGYASRYTTIRDQYASIREEIFGFPYRYAQIRKDSHKIPHGSQL